MLQASFICWGQRPEATVSGGHIGGLGGGELFPEVVTQHYRELSGSLCIEGAT